MYNPTDNLTEGGIPSSFLLSCNQSKFIYNSTCMRPMLGAFTPSSAKRIIYIYVKKASQMLYSLLRSQLDLDLDLDPRSQYYTVPLSRHLQDAMSTSLLNVLELSIPLLVPNHFYSNNELGKKEKKKELSPSMI